MPGIVRLKHTGHLKAQQRLLVLLKLKEAVTFVEIRDWVLQVAFQALVQHHDCFAVLAYLHEVAALVVVAEGVLGVYFDGPVKAGESFCALPHFDVAHAFEVECLNIVRVYLQNLVETVKGLSMIAQLHVAVSFKLPGGDAEWVQVQRTAEGGQSIFVLLELVFSQTAVEIILSLIHPVVDGMIKALKRLIESTQVVINFGLFGVGSGAGLVERDGLVKVIQRLVIVLFGEHGLPCVDVEEGLAWVQLDESSELLNTLVVVLGLVEIEGLQVGKFGVLAKLVYLNFL